MAIALGSEDARVSSETGKSSSEKNVLGSVFHRSGRLDARIGRDEKKKLHRSG